MKMNKVILVSALISTLSLPILAASNVDQSNPVPMSRMAQDSAVTKAKVAGEMPNGMPMNMQGNMKMGQQNGMSASAAGAGQHAGSLDSQQGMRQGGMGMTMMEMMPQKMAEMKLNRELMDVRLSNIESSLQQLVALQKVK